jgi:flavin-dependent thymidylate synthase
MPNVTLIEFTGKGTWNERWHAADILLFTKSTRLSMDPGGLERIAGYSQEDKEASLAAMAKTIPSSWEFVDLTFLFSGVTRACAQQITRTRTASYSMQSQRIVDMSDAAVTNPFKVGTPLYEQFGADADRAMISYMDLIEAGANPQDARGLLPMNTQCNLLAKYNLRSFVDLVRSRSSLRTQGEYADIVKDAMAAVIAVWPWSDVFFRSPAQTALEELGAVAEELGVVPGDGPGWRIAKAMDLIRKGC